MSYKDTDKENPLGIINYNWLLNPKDLIVVSAYIEVASTLADIDKIDKKNCVSFKNPIKDLLVQGKEKLVDKLKDKIKSVSSTNIVHPRIIEWAASSGKLELVSDLGQVGAVLDDKFAENQIVWETYQIGFRAYQFMELFAEICEIVGDNKVSIDDISSFRMLPDHIIDKIIFDYKKSSILDQYALRLLMGKTNNHRKKMKDKAIDDTNKKQNDLWQNVFLAKRYNQQTKYN